MTTGTKIKLGGIVHKTIVKPPILDDSGFLKEQDVEIVLRIPLSDDMRAKLADLSRLQNGQTSYITFMDAQYRFDDTGKAPAKKAPKTKEKKKSKSDPPF